MVMRSSMMVRHARSSRVVSLISYPILLLQIVTMKEERVAAVMFITQRRINGGRQARKSNP